MAHRRNGRHRLVAMAVALATAVTGLTAAFAPVVSAETADPVVMAVGDIACDPFAPAWNNGLGTTAGCQQRAVGDAVRSQHPDAFWPLGDIQYYDGRLEAFMASYDQAFGDLKPITNPVPGNHEYKTVGAAGYYTYFGAASHPESKGTYSFDIGGWHVLSINNITCTARTPCGPGTDMAKWIAWDVAQHPSQCLAAMWHHPLYSAGNNGGYLPMVPVWNQLNAYGADLVLVGHDHGYQRFLPIGDASVGPDGKLAPPVVAPDGNGIVEMVLGMGGEDNFNLNYRNPDPQTVAALAASATAQNPAMFGAEKLVLHPDGYDYSYVPAAGTTYADAGAAKCRTKTPPTGLPPVATGITAVRAGDGAATVSWTATMPPATPDTTFTAVSSPGNRTCRVVNGSSCTMTRLTNGTSYTFTVKADNAVARNVSQPSDPLVVATRPSRPGPPAVVLGQLSATLTWTPPAYTGGLPVSRYTARSTPGGATCETDGALSCTIGGLASGTSYSFSVVASNDAATSYASAGSAGLKAVSAPAPMVTDVVRAGDGAVQVSAAETSNWGTPTTGFTVVSAPAAKRCSIVLPATSCVVTGLTNGVDYTFTATTVNDLGTSAPSVPSGDIVAATRPSRPGTPSVLMGELSASLAWTPPSYEGGLPVNGYVVTSSPGGLTCSTAGDTSCTIEGLTSGTSYSFAVVAVNDAGSSVAGAGSAPQRALAAPTPTVVSVSRAGDGAVLVSATETATWSAPATGYQIVSSPGAKRCTVSVPDTGCVVTGLTNGTTYTFTATTMNELGTSSPSTPSDPIVPATAPTRPGVPSVVMGQLTATLTWTSPAYLGGIPVERYSVTSSPGGLTCTSEVDLTCTVGGLTSGVAYSFAVVATNEVGSSVSGVGSLPVKAVSAPPPAVTGLARAGDGAIAVSAAELATWGGVTATGFTVTSTPGAKRCTVSSPGTTCTVTGLTNGAAYQFSAVTLSPLGTSAASDLSAPLVAGKAPGRPGTPVVSVLGGGSMSLSWTAPTTDGGLPITRHTALSAPGGRTCATTGALTCTVTGLTSGTAYSFSVTATNEAGTSPSGTGSTSVKAT